MALPVLLVYRYFEGLGADMLYSGSIYESVTCYDAGIYLDI